MIEKLDKKELNCNIFSVYDYDGLTMQELLCQFFTRINECIDVSNKGLTILEWLHSIGLKEEVAKQLDTWLKDGTIANIINKELFNSLNDKINNIFNNLPYKKYEKQKLSGEEKNTIFEGKTIFSGNTYGTYENACPLSAITGEEKPLVQVLGTDTYGLSKYENRDSVAFYYHNKGDNSFSLNLANVTFNYDGCILPLGIDTSKIKEGMIIDTLTEPKCVGIVKKVEGSVITLVDGWYNIVPSVGGARTTPTGTTCIINPKYKVWGMNGNVFINEGVKSGVNAELGVFCSHGNIVDTGGIDLINFEKSTHFGYRARGRSIGFQRGYISEKSGIHFEGQNSDPTKTLIQAVNDDNSVFTIKNNGELSTLRVVVQTISTSTTLGGNVTVGLISGSNVTVSLPTPQRGKIISFYSLGTGNKILAQQGQTIVFPNVSHQEIPLTISSGRHGYCQLVSDGTNWYAISTNMHLG